MKKEFYFAIFLIFCLLGCFTDLGLLYNAKEKECKELKSQNDTLYVRLKECDFKYRVNEKTLNFCLDVIKLNRFNDTTGLVRKQCRINHKK